MSDFGLELDSALISLGGAGAPLSAPAWQSGISKPDPDEILVVRAYFREIAPPLVFEGSLSAEELSRAERFRDREDGLRYCAGRFVLRHALAQLLDCTAPDMEMSAAEHGKPGLTGTLPRLHFNAAHTREIFVLVVHPTREVGIDVERASRYEGARLERMFGYISHPAERGVWSAARDEDRPALFTQLWTMKEAILKAHGAGLGIRPRTVDVSECMQAQHGRAEAAGACFDVYGFAADEQHHCAVAVRAPIQERAADCAVVTR